MNRLVIVTVLLACAGEVVAQDQAPRQDAETRGRFFAPVLEVTSLRDQTAVMLGGRGGLSVTPSFMVGLGLYGTLRHVDAPEGAVPTVSYPLDLKMERFGLELEYALHPTTPTHVTASSFVGAGALHYVKSGTQDQEGETDFVLLLQPAVGVEQRLLDRLHLNLAVSWRLAGGVEMAGLTAGDIAGPAVTLAVKLGRF
ncbi:MAG TPA: hypothetical protein VLA36_02305 [Longimicrobiales bacterium]|nr:hypothetical protein [Longimicrobiales bacterium]